MSRSRASIGQEPCAVCLEETAAGSAFFSSRRRIVHPDGAVQFVCAECARKASGPTRQRLSDEELRRFIQGGCLAMIAGMPGGH
jgi:hypothetical protein